MRLAAAPSHITQGTLLGEGRAGALECAGTIDEGSHSDHVLHLGRELQLRDVDRDVILGGDDLEGNAEVSPPSYEYAT